MSIKIENIRPSYDQDEDHDILEFTVNGEKCSEYLSGSFLGREIYGLDGLITKSRLSDGYTEVQISEIHSKLNAWIASSDECFVGRHDNPDIESVEHGLNVSHGDIVVWLTSEAADRLNLEGNAYEVTADGSVKWTDRDFGDQYSENHPGGDLEDFYRRSILANPVAGIGEIEGSLECGNLSQLRKEAENDPKNAPTI